MRPRHLVVVACLAVPGLVACGAEAPEAAATQVTYTCCDAKDINTVYQPGQTITLHWIVSSDNATAEGGPLVELAAHLTGPYASVDGLKASSIQSGSGSPTFAAEPVRPSGTPGERPVSTILIPADAQPGHYNLVWSVTQAGGTVSAASIVRVAAGGAAHDALHPHRRLADDPLPGGVLEDRPR